MPQYTFKMLTEDVLNAEQRPMSGAEIWEAALNRGLAEKKPTNGKTPAYTIASLMSRDPVLFEQVSTRPARYALRSWPKDIKAVAVELEEVSDDSDETKYYEKSLHRLLATFVAPQGPFHCHTKTIDQSKSSTKTGTEGKEKWTHPDMVGVRFAFEEYGEQTAGLIKAMGESPVTLFSFELKKKLTVGTVRECFFQAVSNSSWANEGYLVAKDISIDVREDLQRLSSAFGIGVIELDVENIEQSLVLYPAAHRDYPDWQTIDHIVSLNNDDFNEFIKGVLDDALIGRVKSEYDKPIEDEEAMEAYLIEHGLM